MLLIFYRFYPKTEENYLDIYPKISETIPYKYPKIKVGI